MIGGVGREVTGLQLVRVVIVLNRDEIAGIVAARVAREIGRAHV